jgi:alpha/beta superfamily hydrolase
MKEEAVQFGTPGSLVGIVTSPTLGDERKPGVVLLNPGIVHRVGPGRIYVKIARALAAQGFSVLRFDFSGIGDSLVRLDNRPFEESSVDEACAAMTFLQGTRGITSFILVGGCSGAVASLETTCVDSRSRAAILINFPARADEAQTSYRRDRHYYWKHALLSLTSWRKLLTGQSNYRTIGEALRQGFKHKFIDRKIASGSDQRLRAMMRELVDQGVQLTFICSKGDPLLKELREAGGADLRRLCAHGKVACDVIPSDHTFSSLYDQERLVDAILKRANIAALSSVQQADAGGISSSPVEVVLQQGQSVR